MSAPHKRGGVESISSKQKKTKKLYGFLSTNYVTYTIASDQRERGDPAYPFIGFLALQGQRVTSIFCLDCFFANAHRNDKKWGKTHSIRACIFPDTICTSENILKSVVGSFLDGTSSF